MVIVNNNLFLKGTKSVFCIIRKGPDHKMGIVIKGSGLKNFGKDRALYPFNN